MALVLQDRVKESSASSGTGSVVLTGAFTGYRTFASCIPDGSTVYYCIHNLSVGAENEWEVGLGTYTLSTTTLARTTVLSSSNSSNLVNFTSGVNGLEVFITYPAEKAVYEQANGETIINDGPITVVGANVTTLPTFDAELGKFVGNVDLFAQIYNLNQNSGANASSDFVVYNSDTDVNGTTFFADMGINSPNYSSVDYPIFTPNSGYFFSYGDGGSNTSPLFLGSGDGAVKIFAGGLDTNNTAVTIGTDLSATFEGAVVANSTLDVTGVAVFDTFVYSGANVAAAANSTVLTTKAYVDASASTAFVVHAAVVAATPAGQNLGVIYNNGTAGVGATLTADTDRAFTTLDDVAVTLGQRVLIKNQTSAFQNGIYTLTTVGSNGVTPWVLTRASDFDTAAAGEIANNAYVYVTGGATQLGTSWVLAQLAAITVGTTDLPFDLFAQPVAYTVDAPLSLTGTTLSLSGTVAATNGGTGQNTTTVGDLLYGTSSNTWSKLALGAANKSLVVNGSGTQVEWNAVSLNASGAVSGTLDETNGGTGNSTYTTGDTLYSSAANTLAKLAGNTTTTKKYLQQQGDGANSAAPSWQQVAAADISGLAASATTDTTNASNISSGTLANARTSASSSNGASTIVARDASGNFSANTITANVTGSISGSAATLTTARNFQISGGATAANVSFDGSAAVNLAVTAMNASVINSGTIPNANTTASSSNGASTIVARDASGNFTANNVSATNLLGSVTGSGAGLTSLNATAISSGTLANARTTAASTNGASTIVARDASGNFAANTITANLTGTASNATVLQTARTIAIGTGATGTATSFNGSAAITIPITDVNASYIGTGTLANARTTASSSNGASTIVARDASGNFTANTVTAALTGNASTATTLQTARTIAIGTGATGTATSFNGSAAITIPITDVNASYIGTGTLANARTSASSSNGASTIVARDASGNFTANVGTFTTISGAGGSVTAINASNISTGTLANARTTASSSNGASTIVARDASGNFTANSITANGDVTSSSDESLKTDWSNLIYDFVEKLAEVKSGVYKRIDSGATQVGVSAQSLAQVLPQATSFDENGKMTVAYGQAALVAAVELAKQVVELKKEIAELKAK